MSVAEGIHTATGNNGKPKPPRPTVTYREGWHEFIPAELRGRAQWVCWRYRWDGTRWTKVPYCARSPDLKASSTESSTWSDFATALACFEAHRDDFDPIDGPGFVFGPDAEYTGIDLDHSLDEEGRPYEWAERIVHGLDSYTEVSPSGQGLHVYVRGSLPEKARHKVGGFGPDGSGVVETYDKTRYFTANGRHLAGSPRAIRDRQEELDAFCREWFPPADAGGGVEAEPRPGDVDDEFVLRMARTSKGCERFKRLFDEGEITGFGSQSNADLSLCSSLYFWTGGRVKAVDRLFRRSALMRPKWDRRAGSMTYGERTIAKAMTGHRSLYDPEPTPAAAAEPSANANKPPSAIEAPDDPHRLARVVRAPFVDARGNPTLVCYRGGFYIWDGTRYRPDPIFVTKTVVDESKAEIDRQNIAAIAAHTGKNPPPTARKVTTGLVKNVVQALTAMCSIDREGDAPFWIGREEGDPDPREVIPARNGLVDIGGAAPVLLSHSPRFFSTHALDYNYDPDAPEPEKWNAFLRDQWADDDESIYTLHEVLGDMLVPTEGIHPLHLWIGPPRSGRGTMREVATALVGRWNVTATSPVSLSGPFGLESLLDKKLAVMGDARTGDSHDSAVMMDRLLRITGGDPVEVNCKGRPILPDVRMNLRMLVISNEMPNFRDSSGAIVSRYVILATTKTIPKEERNPRLAAELKAELPGILNEAIRSLKTLRLRKHFLQPKSSEHLIDDAGDIASPVRTFVAERKCPLGADETVPTATLFDDWKRWAIVNGYQVGNIGTFGKNLKAAYPNIRKTRPREDDKQVSTYEGIGRGLPLPF